MCDCRSKVNAKLADKNARIATGFQLAEPPRGMTIAPPEIVLEKVDKTKRGKLPILLASYCPFCGDQISR